MGHEKFLVFIKKADGSLVFEPGWSEENLTGFWRSVKPVIDHEKCTRCALCWLYCPDAAITKNEKYEINYKYCKGCLICVEECPVKAIDTEEEP